MLCSLIGGDIPTTVNFVSANDNSGWPNYGTSGGSYSTNFIPSVFNDLNPQGADNGFTTSKY